MRVSISVLARRNPATRIGLQKMVTMFKLQVRGSPLGSQPRATRACAFVPVCSLPPQGHPASTSSTSRRESLSGLLALTGGLLLQGQAPLQASAAGKTPSNAVETYLPKDESNPGFVRYEPDAKKTPVRRFVGVTVLTLIPDRRALAEIVDLLCPPAGHPRRCD